MKKNIRQNLKNTKGITLVALVVTIIVLLILAGVSLSAVLSDKGIFSRAENAGNKYNEAKAREVIETVLLADGQYEKHTNSEYNQDDYLDDLIKNEIPEAEIRGDIVIIGDYAFELDRSVPKIGPNTLNPKDLIWPVVTVAEKTQANASDNYRIATINIKATIDEKAENGINRIEIWQNGIKLKTIPCSNEKEVTTTYQANTNGVYTIKAYSKVTDTEMTNEEISGSAKTTVEGIIPAVEFTPHGSTEWKKSHEATVKVNETAGTVTSMKYLWKKSSEGEPQVSDFKESCTNNSQITGQGDTMTGKYYLWVLVTLGTGENQRTYISESEEFYFDNEGPEIDVSASSASTSSISITVNLTDEHVKNVSSYSIYVDGELKKSDAFDKNPVTYTAQDITEGTHSFMISAIDSAGNESRKGTSHELVVYKWQKHSTKLELVSYEETCEYDRTRCLSGNTGSEFYTDCTVSATRCLRLLRVCY